MASDNVIDYPLMSRQREEYIQQGELARADDVNAELNSIIDTYNRLVGLLQGEWGGDTGRIYELVDEAVRVANEALTKANGAVLRTGDTMSGQLNQPDLPVSEYNLVNKKYVDTKVQDELASPINRITTLEDRLDNLNATQVKLDNANFTGKNVNDGMNELFISVSNGKKIIAAAITDKGVKTSGDDSFKQMRDNIMSIVTFNEGTAGGTATPADVRKGKTFYARNNYYTGTYEPLDTSDATATSDTILQGYTAYANGNKIYGTYVGSGSPGGGIILGPDEVVATKVFGEAGVLTGGRVSPDNSQISFINCKPTNVKMAIVNGEYLGTYVIADRYYTEGIANEIVIYNVVRGVVSHKDYTAKYSYTYNELGISGTVLNISASPLTGYDQVSQITIATSEKIYVFYFNPNGNNKNGSIGEPTAYSNASKIIIDSSIGTYNGIAYSNTDKNVFAIEVRSTIKIYRINWTTETAEELASFAGGDTRGLFRFSKSDRFLMFAPWSTLGKKVVSLVLLERFNYITKVDITENIADQGWKSSQLLINSKDDFMILDGKPYSLTYSISGKTIEYQKLSDTEVIPYSNGYNESLYATFSSNDKYVYAAIFEESTPSGLKNYGCYKVDLTKLDAKWELVSPLFLINSNSNGNTFPAMNLLNDTIIGFNSSGMEGPYTHEQQGMYYFYADPNIKEIIGLSYNGDLYRRMSI